MKICRPALFLIIIMLHGILSCSLAGIIFDGGGDGAVLFGYIDKTGNELITPSYKDAADFIDGLAAVKTSDGRWGYIDKKGVMVIPPRFFRAGNFSGGLAPACSENGEPGKNWGYIDKKGEWIIRPQFWSAKEFHNGIARVTIDYTPRSGFANHRHAYIDHSGEIVVKDDGKTTYLESDHYYSDGLLPVVTADGTWGFKNIKNELIIPGRFYEVRSFSDGYAAVAVKIDSPDALKQMSELVSGIAGDILKGVTGDKSVILWGYVDISGKPVIPCSYLQAGDFIKGSALVNREKSDPVSLNGYFFINKKGEPQSGKVYERVRDSRTGYACVSEQDEQKNTLYYFIDRSEKSVIRKVNGMNISFCDSFADGAAYVMINSPQKQQTEISKSLSSEYEGFIDSKGVPVFPLKERKDYYYPKKFSDGMAVFKRYYQR